MSTPPVARTPRLPTSALIFRALQTKPHTIDELTVTIGRSRQSVITGLKLLRVESKSRKRPKGKGGQPQKEWALITGAKLQDLFERADRDGC